MASVRPRAIAIIASVTMNGTSLNHDTEKPFSAPTIAPTASATASPPSPSPTFPAADPAITVAATMPLSATSEPTERSIPEVMITNVAPTAAMPTTETCTMTLVSVLVVRNSGDAIESTTQISTSAANSGPMPLRNCRMRRCENASESACLVVVDVMPLLLS